MLSELNRDQVHCSSVIREQVHCSSVVSELDTDGRVGSGHTVYNEYSRVGISL